MKTETCEACEGKGYLEVTCADMCEYIQPCDNCNYIDMYGDLFERCFIAAEKDGYKIDKEGKIQC